MSHRPSAIELARLAPPWRSDAKAEGQCSAPLPRLRIISTDASLFLVPTHAGNSLCRLPRRGSRPH